MHSNHWVRRQRRVRSAGGLVRARLPRDLLALGTAILVGAGSASCSFARSPTMAHSGSAASIAVVRASLAAKTSLRTAVVQVPSGFDAAAYDLHGHLQFWQYASGTWREAAQSTYPEAVGDGPGSYDERGISVRGADLPGAPHAVFIVAGPFTGDGSGQDVVYGDGPQGWGALDQQGQASLSSSGMGPSDGTRIYLDTRFTSGTLETVRSSGAFDEAFGSAFPVRSYWRWSNSGLVLDGDNVVTAHRVPDTPEPAVPLPSAAPPDGIYGALIEGATQAESSGASATPGASAPSSTASSGTGSDPGIVLTLRPARIQGTACTAASTCVTGSVAAQYTEMLTAATPTDYPVALAGQQRGEISGPLWPLVGVAVSDWPSGGDSPLGAQDLGGLSTFASPGQTPWYIPNSLRAETLAPLLKGEPAEITFSHGRPVGIRLL